MHFDTIDMKYEEDGLVEEDPDTFKIKVESCGYNHDDRTVQV